MTRRESPITPAMLEVTRRYLKAGEFTNIEKDQQVKNLEQIVERRLRDAENNAKEFDKRDMPNSSEIWWSIAGILQAILDEAKEN
jgi:hypothetical protein